MESQYFRTMFGAAARAAQQRAGSRAHYGAREAVGERPDPLTAHETAFIAARDSFYLATTTPGGWPYVQHRGGPAGFLRVLGENRIGYLERPGNRQFITQGNLQTSDRVALFLMDYPARRRLKLIGHARQVSLAPGAPLAALFGADAGTAIVIDVLGLDWNCPQYITPRLSEAEQNAALAALSLENNALRAELARLKETRR